MTPEAWAQIGARSWGTALGVLGQFASPGIALFWGYLLSAAVIAALVHVARRGGPRGVLAFVAPREVWLRRGTLDDLGLFVLNTLVYSFWLLPSLSFAAHALASWTWSWLHGGLGPLASPISGPAATIGLTIAVFVVSDLAMYLAHRVMHLSPVLWEFHKTHHSAAALQPLTIMRRHPVSVAVEGVITLALLGPLYGLAGWLGGGGLGLWTIAGVNGLLFLALLAGFNLQHSHVWLSFGPADRWLISPATHQLHHSSDARHYDRNFGNLLAIWDRLAGSLLLPAQVVGADGEAPEIDFGLGPAGGGWERAYTGTWRLLLAPFWRAALVARGRLRRTP